MSQCFGLQVCYGYIYVRACRYVMDPYIYHAMYVDMYVIKLCMTRYVGIPVCYGSMVRLFVMDPRM